MPETTRDELRNALRLHEWLLTGRSGGKRANFRGADLSALDLS
jgi:hypothetical protein